MWSLSVTSSSRSPHDVEALSQFSPVSTPSSSPPQTPSQSESSGKRRRRRRKRKHKHKPPLRLRATTHVDSLGFLVDSHLGCRYPDVDVPAATVTGRIGKWLAMMESETPLREGKKTKSRARKGIPKAVRGKAWKMLLAGKDDPEEAYAAALEGGYPPDPDSVLVKDLHRTLPDHPVFAGKGGPGQAGLCRVLSAATYVRSEVGYCQGIGFVAAFLLLFMDEASAFASLVALCDSGPDAVYGLGDLYAPGLPDIVPYCQTLQALLRMTDPELADHMAEVGMEPEIYAMPWFMTLFASVLPAAYTVRILDVFFTEGRKILFRVALALIATVRAQALAADFGGLMGVLRASVYSPGVTPGELIDNALGVGITRAEVAELLARHRQT